MVNNFRSILQEDHVDDYTFAVVCEYVSASWQLNGWLVQGKPRARVIGGVVYEDGEIPKQPSGGMDEDEVFERAVDILEEGNAAADAFRRDGDFEGLRNQLGNLAKSARALMSQIKAASSP